STGAANPARFSAQRKLEPCRSASTSTVLRPSCAKCAARFVAIVVLPQPPLELATRTLRIRVSPATRCGKSSIPHGRARNGDLPANSGELLRCFPVGRRLQRHALAAQYG